MKCDIINNIQKQFGIDNNGSATLYDIVKITPKKITEATDTIQGNSQVSRREASVENNATTLSSESQVFSEKRDRYEAKQRYVDRRNAESRENAVGLSEEQTDALEWLARTRHEIHSSHNRFWNPEAGGTTWNYFDDDSFESINNHLTSAGLEPIDFGEYRDIPTSDDYYSILSDEEREEWESYAEENGYYSGLTAWTEKSDEYYDFLKAMEKYNDQIENYLKNIDDKHNTSYTPTGFARLGYSTQRDSEQDYYTEMTDVQREQMYSTLDNILDEEGKPRAESLNLNRLNANVAQYVKDFNLIGTNANELTSKISALYNDIYSTNDVTWDDVVNDAVQIAKDVMSDGNTDSI